MRRNWCLWITILFFTSGVCFGISKKTTYTDISRDNSYLNSICVAEILEEHAVPACKELLKELPKAPIIAKVTGAGTVEHLAFTSRQLVMVKEIYQGDDLEEGEQVYLTCSNWSLSLYGDPYSMERGFVNILNTGEDYLVFIEKQADGLGEKIPVYSLYCENIISPVFSLEEHENKIVDTARIHTYVLYSQVKDNEFFAASQTAMDALEELKNSLMKMYLRSEEYERPQNND